MIKIMEKTTNGDRKIKIKNDMSVSNLKYPEGKEDQEGGWREILERKGMKTREGQWTIYETVGIYVVVVYERCHLELWKVF